MPVAWIWDVVVMLYMYIFAPDYVTAQQSWHGGRHQLHSVGLATVIRHVPAFLGLGMVPTAESPDTGPLDVLLLRQHELFTRTLNGRRLFFT